MLAVFVGNLKLVRFLIENRAHVNITDVNGRTALFDAFHKSHVEICGRLLVAGSTLQPDCVQDRSSFIIQVLDWMAERLACHRRFMTVVLFAMHDCSGTVLLPKIGNLENVKVLVAEFLDIQTGADLRRLRGITPALQAIAVNDDDDDDDDDGDGY